MDKVSLNFKFATKDSVYYYKYNQNLKFVKKCYFYYKFILLLRNKKYNLNFPQNHHVDLKSFENSSYSINFFHSFLSLNSIQLVSFKLQKVIF